MGYKGYQPEGDAISFLERKMLQISDKCGVSFYEIRKDFAFAAMVFESASNEELVEYVQDNYECEEGDDE